MAFISTPSISRNYGLRNETAAETRPGRGQITLPARLRKRLGIKGGDPVLLEEKGNAIVLKPALVVEVDRFSDDQVAEWDRADRLTGQDRKRFVEAVKNRT